MEECRILFLNAEARRKKQESQPRRLSGTNVSGIRPAQKNSAEVIDLGAIRTAAKPHPVD